MAGQSRKWRVLVAVGAIVVVTGLALAMYRACRAGPPSTIPGLRSVPVGGLLPIELSRAITRVAAAFMAQPIQLVVHGRPVATVVPQELAAIVDEEATAKQLLRIGNTGDLLADLAARTSARLGRLDLALHVHLDTPQALPRLLALKTEIDRAPAPPRLDLEHRRVRPGRPGHRLLVHRSLAAIEQAMRQGRAVAAVAVQVTDPTEGSPLRNIDVSHLLGRFSTVYSLADKDRDRVHNLKLGSSRLDANLLAPGQHLSFNETVGPRTPARGYRTAPVISQGELVDGMAGGACQLSSTLFAAAFFAGLDLVRSRPHSIPSGYIKMGLDAAVAYPEIDLVIANPYPFAVAIHMKVSQGRVEAQILGKKRPWQRVTMIRTIVEQKPFEEVTRPDSKLPAGVRSVVQAGIPGFVLERQRLFFRADSQGQPDRTETRTLRYPPTTQIVRVGTGPAQPDFVAPPDKTGLGQVPEQFTLSQ